MAEKKISTSENSTDVIVKENKVTEFARRHWKKFAAAAAAGAAFIAGVCLGRHNNNEMLDYDDYDEPELDES